MHCASFLKVKFSLPLLRDAPVRRLRKAGKSDPSHRKAVYVDDSDVTLRREGWRARSSSAKRVGVIMDGAVTEKTPLLNDLQNVITSMSRDQQQSADNMATRSENLQNETTDAFKKMKPSSQKRTIWTLCCCCCCRSKDPDR